jgi:hypothetical protein
MDLTVLDFKNEDNYRRYFLLVMGLLEYACAIISGNEGSGKSLLQAYLTYQILRLFPEKRGTLDWNPPATMLAITDVGRSLGVKDRLERDILDVLKTRYSVIIKNLPMEMGISRREIENSIENLSNQGAVVKECPEVLKKCDYLLDDEIVDKLLNEVNAMAKYKIKPPIEELRTLLVFNRVFGLDECDSYADKGYRTNLTRLIGRIITRRRHFHTSMFMVFVDPDTADKRYIWRRRTHMINCSQVGEDACSYWIFNERTKKGRFLDLTPSNWSHIWDTHNVVPISHESNIDLGSSKGKKKQKAEQQKTDNQNGAE